MTMDDKNEDLCQFCFDKVTFLCLSCKICLCRNCVSVHIKMKPRDSHKIVTANEKSQVKTKQLKVLGKISSGMESLCDISYNENGTFYSCSEISKSISLLDDSGLTRDTFEGCKNPLCLTASSNGVLYTEFGIKAVMFNSKGRTKHLFSTGDWQPQGISMSKSGNILLTLRRKNESKLIVSNPHGYVCREIQYHNNKPLFFDPWYVAENPKGDICVSDQARRALICIKTNGELIFKYYGRGSLFYPRGLCADATSHFIAADPWNNLLHYISSCGELVYYLKYDSMDSPMGLSCNYDRKNSFLICEVSGSIYHVELE